MTTAERVVLGVDPHKASWTAAVVDHTHRVRGQLRVPASRQGYRQLRRLARRWPTASLTWAVEGAHGLGLPLVQRLATDAIQVVDVPAKLSARVRLLATGHGRKTDVADAVATAIAALTPSGCAPPPSRSTPLRCGCSATTATTWSEGAPRPSTGCTCCWSGWCRPARRRG